MKKVVLKLKEKNFRSYVVNKIEIEEWLEKYKIKNYIINEDLSIDVSGDVTLRRKDLSSIPVRFGIVRGDFDCSSNRLLNLEGCPVAVGGNYNCSSNQLFSLKDCPISIGGNFDCSGNELTDLVGCSGEIGSAYYCSNNNVILEEKNLYNGKGEKIGVYYVNEKLNCELSEDR